MIETGKKSVATASCRQYLNFCLGYFESVIAKTIPPSTAFIVSIEYYASLIRTSSRLLDIDQTLRYAVFVPSEYLSCDKEHTTQHCWLQVGRRVDVNTRQEQTRLDALSGITPILNQGMSTRKVNYQYKTDRNV